MWLYATQKTYCILNNQVTSVPKVLSGKKQIYHREGRTVNLAFQHHFRFLFPFNEWVNGIQTIRWRFIKKGLPYTVWPSDCDYFRNKRLEPEPSKQFWDFQFNNTKIKYFSIPDEMNMIWNYFSNIFQKS